MSAANDNLSDRLAYGPADAARVMSVSRATVFEWIRQGKVRSVKIGGRTLIAREELLRLLKPDAA